MKSPTSESCRNLTLGCVFVCLTSLLHASGSIPIDATPKVVVDASKEPVASGKFEPNWQSLSQYQVPDWYRNAKFGIWAHWGPQCQAESGDWYARGMYEEGSWQYKYHVGRYGHPSQAGFKDVIREWKAEKWNPERLVDLYKRTGAKYFFAMANHHDNMDLWDSRYQPWNSVKLGPRQDIVAGWAKAARHQKLPFGVSVHASRAWSWYELAQSADKHGDNAGVPYDGRLTKADGKGKWWEGLDPQDLYEQDHTPGPESDQPRKLFSQWNWDNGVSQPDQAYCDKFYNRTIDLINKYQPELLYFDDTALPLWPVSDAGLKIAAHFYNSNLNRSNGADPGVLFGKVLDDAQRKALVWDIERGVPNKALPHAWQTDTCIGSWHYDRGVYDRGQYKDAKTIIHMLADIVSKNGNLLLNIPVRGDGSIDEKEEKILEGIAGWMGVNQESIFDTRPWKTFGEGPASEGSELSGQGFNEGKGKPFTAEDVRFTTKGDVLYAIVMGVPDKDLAIQSLGRKAALAGKSITSVELLGGNVKPTWNQNDDALVVAPPTGKPANNIAVVYRIQFAR